ncbi:hypothetical protein DFH28DRAFT_932925 [Melampsora americana]|nr:hypothetical protein DFH28DRAFT_932925 [Melampsora americana]
MMSYISPRFVTLALIMITLFGAYNAIPLENGAEHSKPREGTSSTPRQPDMPPFTPLRAHKPVQTGLERRMMGGGGGKKHGLGGGGGGGAPGGGGLMSMMGGGGGLGGKGSGGE